jgi:hypothetical protein
MGRDILGLVYSKSRQNALFSLKNIVLLSSQLYSDSLSRGNTVLSLNMGGDERLTNLKEALSMLSS